MRNQYSSAALVVLPWRVLLTTVLTTALLAVLAVAPSAAASAAHNAVPITGQILADGKPLAGANIELTAMVPAEKIAELVGQGRLTPPPVASTTSGKDGRFKLLAPANGLWQVTVSSPLHIAMALDLAALIGASHLGTVELPVAEDLAYRVVDEQQQPISEVQICFQGRHDQRVNGPLAQRWRDINKWYVALNQVTTDAEGWASLRLAPDDRLSVELRLSDGQLHKRDLAVADHAATTTIRPAPASVLEVRDRQGRRLTDTLVVGTFFALGASDSQGLLAARFDTNRPSTWLRDGILKRDPKRADQPWWIELQRRELLRGRVFDAQSGEPVAGAFVWPYREGGSFVRTADDGSFELMAGYSNLRVRAPGYKPIFHRTDDERRSAGIELHPIGVIAGLVTDTHGSPVADVGVAFSHAGSAPAVQGEAWVLTDSEGQFTLLDLPIGTALDLHLRASESAVSTVISQPALDPGEERIGQVLALSHGGAGSGQVLAAAGGGPVSGARIVLLRDARQQVAETLSDSRGRFRFDGLTPGTYHVLVRAADFSRSGLHASEVTEDMQTIDFGKIELQPASSIAGHVVDHEGEPVSDARVEALGFDNREHRAPADRGQRFIATSQADGSFAISGLPTSGRGELVADAEGKASLRMEVTAPADEVSIVLQPALDLSGEVLDERGEPVAGASVLAFPEGDSSLSFKSARVAEDGQFHFDDLSPGRFKIMAHAQGFQPFELAGVELAQGVEHPSLSITLRSGLALVGRVLDPHGRPVPAADISAQVQPSGLESQLGGQSETDADGQFRLEGLEPARWRVGVYSEAWGRLYRSVDVFDQDAEVTLQFPSGVIVAGDVSSTTGRPLAGADVMLQPFRDRDLPSLKVRSESDGSFHFSNVVPGTYRLASSKTGYYSNSPRRTLQVDGPQAGVELVLRPGLTLRGRILDFDAQSMANYSIQVIMPGGRPSPIASDGSFVVEDIRPGAGRIRVVDERRNYRGEAGVTVAEDGEPPFVEISLNSRFRVTGTVSSEYPLPSSGMGIQLHRIGSSSSLRSEVDAEGSFRFDLVPAGSYKVTVHNSSSGLYRGALDIDRDQELNLDLELAGLNGRVISVDGEVVANASILLREDYEGKTGSMRAISGRSRSQGDGVFQLSPMATGRWVMRVEAPGFSAYERQIELSRGERREVEVVLQRGTPFRFRVVNGLGEAAMEVVYTVSSDDVSHTMGFPQLQADTTGVFTLDSLDPGSYRIFLMARGSAVTPFDISVPGDGGTLRLTTGASLALRFSEPLGQRQLKLKLRDANGVAYLFPSGLGPTEEFLVPGSMVSQLEEEPIFPVGTWQLELTAGEWSWSGTVELLADQPNVLELPAVTP